MGGGRSWEVGIASYIVYIRGSWEVCVWGGSHGGWEQPTRMMEARQEVRWEVGGTSDIPPEC